MSNLQKFNTTLEEFDKEVGKLKSVSEAYQKLESLIRSYEVIINQFIHNNETLENNNQILIKSLSDLNNLIDAKTDTLRKENKEFYNELENTIKLKLNDNKSEIKQLIEHERNQIKQIFEIEFTKTTKELNQFIVASSDKQTQILLKNQNGIKSILWILGIISILLSGSILFMLLKVKGL